MTNYNKNVIHDNLQQFQTFWDAAFNGDYQHYGEMITLTKKIKEMAYPESFIKNNLSLTEQIIYAHVEILYKTLTH